LSVKDFVAGLKGKSEVEITVKGRQTGKTHSTPVWFIHEGNRIYLLPVSGSDTNWYRNILKDPNMTLTVGGKSVKVRVKPITEPDRVKKAIGLFAGKYGGMSEINRWYSKLDVAAEISLI